MLYVVNTHLVTQDTLNTLDTGRLVLVENLLDGSGDLPVLGSGLDSADGGLSSLVSGGDEGSLDVGDGGGSDDDAEGGKGKEGVSSRFTAKVLFLPLAEPSFSLSPSVIHHCKFLALLNPLCTGLQLHAPRIRSFGAEPRYQLTSQRQRRGIHRCELQRRS